MTSAFLWLPRLLSLGKRRDTGRETRQRKVCFFPCVPSFGTTLNVQEQQQDELAAQLVCPAVGLQRHISMKCFSSISIDIKDMFSTRPMMYLFLP